MTLCDNKADGIRDKPGVALRWPSQFIKIDLATSMLVGSFSNVGTSMTSYSIRFPEGEIRASRGIPVVRLSLHLGAGHASATSVEPFLCGTFPLKNKKRFLARARGRVKIVRRSQQPFLRQ